MTPRLTVATAGRVLRQVRHDPRTIALLLVVPVRPARAAGLDLRQHPGLRPARRAAAGDLPVHRHVPCDQRRHPPRAAERHPRAAARDAAGKGDLIGGYALAFGVLAAGQALVASGFAVYVLGLDVAGPALAARRRGDRGRRPRHRARPVRQRVRAQRVPGRAVPAGVHPSAVPAVRAADAAGEPDVRAQRGLRRPAPLVRRRRHAVGRWPPTRPGSADCSRARFAVGALALGAATLRRRTP